MTSARGLALELRQLFAGLLVALIRIYQLTISPLLGPSCRFSPSCSAYAIEAIRQYGPVRGLGRALARLGRCQPFREGGHDPVR